MTRKDLLTGEVFMPQRINQVFANSFNRIAYHNQKANELRRRISYITKPLLTNVRICNDLMKNKREEVFHKQFLMGKGFSFKVHNHVEEYQGKMHYAVFQFIIVILENDLIKIVRND
jgi:hypothetical protein